VKQKFDAYFTFTRPLCRSYPDPGGQPWFVYPDNSLMSDLTVLAALFGETYQAFDEHGSGPLEFAKFVRANVVLQDDFKRIVEGSSPTDPDGSFWHFGPEGSGQVPLTQAVSGHLEWLLKTLRNGFLHFHWRYENLAALDYWAVQRWSITSAPVDFDLSNRPKKNYMAYVADGKDWDPHNFWSLQDLRILVTPYGILRYHLHLILNYLVNGVRVDVFGNAG